jgi:hypothetical protein
MHDHDHDSSQSKLSHLNSSKYTHYAGKTENEHSHSDVIQVPNPCNMFARYVYS